MAMMHNLKHNKVIHERVVLCTVIMEPTPFVDPATRLESFPLAEGFRRIVLRFGFMEEPNIPKSLAQARSDQLGFFYEPMSISYFLSRETLIPKAGKGLSKWREFIFAWMARSASGSMDFFHLPPNRVVELGTQVEL
jgi:KUP system potassium uptake protein